MCEDLQVKYDGTVRDTTGKIFEWSYNEGLDPVKQVKSGGKLKFCDIGRLVGKLNMQHEISNDKKDEDELDEEELDGDELDDSEEDFNVVEEELEDEFADLVI